MKKKGFTLIELLAVIVILAVLALILTPMIQDLIANASEAAFKQTINGILSSAENYVTSYSLDNNGTELTYPVVFTCDGVECKDENNNKLLFNGKVPVSGTITITETSIVAENLCDEKHCGSGAKDALIVSGGGTTTPSLAIGTEWNFNYLNPTKIVNNYPVYEFNYIGEVTEFKVPETGTYKLEVWGAQGGSYNDTYRGGYGGYSTGEINLEKGQIIYVAVGSQGCSGANKNICGGYNGGGSAKTMSNSDYAGGGGGATHMALNNNLGELKNYVDTKEDVIIVAAGGGGAYYYTNFNSAGGEAGGLTGGVAPTGTCSGRVLTNGAAATQTTGGEPNICGDIITGSGTFGQGSDRSDWASGGGGGYYGGGFGYAHGANGGSSYIGSLSNASTKAGNESMPTHDGTSTMTGNKGNGYAKITLLKNTADIANQNALNVENQEFVVPQTGTYKLEVWGAQGGSYTETYHGGYGGYSTGAINLTKGQTIYINVGGQGLSGTAHTRGNMGGGGYNGGGDRSGWNGCSSCNYQSSGGGGATHIATVSGVLSSLETYKGVLSEDEKYYISNEIIIVAGGGGGNGYADSGSNTNFTGTASGGGYKGVTGNTYHGGLSGTAGTQTTGYAFGTGRSGPEGVDDGGGGGFYGGHLGYNGAGGGSGYIANPNLSDKVMYCYGCEQELENSELYTISTTGSSADRTICPDGVSKDAVSKCAKKGNGYAKITLIK